jgi:multidrug efflux pump subunit AcrB
MLIGVAAFAATIYSFATLPMTFQPPLNLDFSQVQIEMPPGSTIERTNVVANKVVRLLRSKPEVENAFADVGPTSAELFVTLKKERTRSSVDFERAYSPELQAIPDARINFQSQAGNQSGRDLNLTLVGDDPARIEQAAEKIIAEMRKLPEIRAPRINGELQRPEITIKPRLDLAADLGVTTAALSQSIRIATLGDIDQNSAKFSLSDRQVPIRVSLPLASRRNVDTIANLPVPTASGGSVPLKHVAEISFGAGPSELKRYNQRRRTSIGADLAPGIVTSVATAKIDALPSVTNLPDGVEKVEVGAAKWQAELVNNFILAVIAGVFLVFAVLVLLYRRVLPPFVNMGSLLLAPLGGAIALHLTGNAMSLPVMIGLLMLLGIVAKNSILLIDFAIEEIAKGVDKDDAIVDAGHKRAQPIVMTTVAMVAGMLPIALSFTGDGSWRAPMGVVVIGGLILSTLLTLVIVPAGFHLADSFEQWLGRRLGRVLTYRGEEPRSGPRPAPQAAE